MLNAEYLKRETLIISYSAGYSQVSETLTNKFVNLGVFVHQNNLVVGKYNNFSQFAEEKRLSSNILLAQNSLLRF